MKSSRIPYATFWTGFKDIGIRNVNDNVIIFGKTQLWRGIALRDVFDIATTKHLEFGINKCQFDQKQLEYFGYIFSADGIAPSSRAKSSH